MTATPTERIAVFLDFANIDRSASDAGANLGYEHLLEYLSAGRHLVEAIAYIPIDPRAQSAMDRQTEDLWLGGYFVKPKIGKVADDTFKCNVDVEMTMDMMNAALVMKIDTVVLVSGDGDFVPVVEYLRGRGIRVEVCGFRETMAREMILKCTGYVDANAYIDELEQAGDEEPEQ